MSLFIFQNPRIIPGGSPNVNDGLGVLMMCQCKFTDCNKCTTPVGDVEMGEAMHEWGQGIFGNSLFCAQFCTGPKLLKKMSEREKDMVK